MLLDHFWIKERFVCSMIVDYANNYTASRESQVDLRVINPKLTHIEDRLSNGFYGI